MWQRLKELYFKVVLFFGGVDIKDWENESDSFSERQNLKDIFQVHYEMLPLRERIFFGPWIAQSYQSVQQRVLWVHLIAINIIRTIRITERLLFHIHFLIFSVHLVFAEQFFSLGDLVLF